LIAGVVPNIFSQIKASKERLNLRDMLLMLIPCAIVLLISLPNFGAGGAGTDVYVDLPMMLYIFVVGVIAAASLLIPGLSGSFILLIAGIYPLAINAVSSIRILITDIGNLEPLFNIVRVLGPLGIGVIIGVLLTARLIERLLKSRQKEVYQVVLGLLSGSIIVLIINHALIHIGDGVLTLIIGLICLAIGFFVPYKLNTGNFDVLKK
jgi:putative membrane protein